MKLMIGGAYQGKTAYASQNFTDMKIIDDYHNIVQEQLEQGLDPMEEAKKLLIEETSHLLIICNEVGCGVVPMSKKEREWREAVGRVSCYLAAEAEEVIRVFCGIGSRIK